MKNEFFNGFIFKKNSKIIDNKVTKTSSHRNFWQGWFSWCSPFLRKASRFCTAASVKRVALRNKNKTRKWRQLRGRCLCHYCWKGLQLFGGDFGRPVAYYFWLCPHLQPTRKRNAILVFFPLSKRLKRIKYLLLPGHKYI